MLKVINASEKAIRLAAYSFTSPAVVKALLMAKKRGVDVQVVVDEKGNRGKANIAELNLLANAGISTRTIPAYAIHHDKYIISDNKHLQTGSFNYSKAAATSNSENVIVIWNNSDIAAPFIRHWGRGGASQGERKEAFSGNRVGAARNTVTGFSMGWEVVNQPIHQTARLWEKQWSFY